jgi:tRNA(Ile2) C34 agmatinyltransferase TiaS
MRTALAIFFVVMIELLFVLRSVNSIKKSRQERRGRNRCETCGSRLEAAESQHARTCRKCGTRQS